MRLTSVIDIVGGELINSSSIAHFNDIKFYPKSIRQGDIFIAFDKTLIYEAVENGAYGILFEGDIKFEHKLDVALIKVNSILNSSLKLFRLILLNKSFKFFLLDDVSFELAQKIITHKKVAFLTTSNLDNFHKITISEEETIFLSSNVEFLNTIWPLYEVINKESLDLIVIKEYLFETTFSFKDEFFYKAKISPFFIKNLSKVLEFCNSYDIELSLKLLNFIKHFEPIFVDKYFHIKEFAKSDKVLIFEPDLKLFVQEMEFLTENTKWAKNKFFLIDSLNSDLKNVNFFNNNQSLMQMLKTINFNFSLIGGIQAQDFKILLDIKIEEKSLF